MPEFVGRSDPEVYLDFERKIERIFEFKELDDEKCCMYVILKLRGVDLLWFEGFKIWRACEEK